MRVQLIAVCAAVAGLLTGNCSKKEEPPKSQKVVARASPANQILDGAIQAHGGLDKLRTSARAVVQLKGKGSRGEYTATLTFLDEHQRLDVQPVSGKPYTLVRGPDQCWHRIGPVLETFSGGEKGFLEASAAMAAAQFLWPLRAKNLSIRSGEIQLDGKTYDTLILHWLDLDAEGTLVLDQTSHLLVRYLLKTFSQGKAQRQEVVLSEYRDFCGFKHAARRTVLIDGVQTETLEFSGMTCGEVDPSVIQPPEQVKDGTVTEDDIAASTLVCTEAPSREAAKGEGFRKLTEFVQQRQLSLADLPVLVYPGDGVTQACLPIEPPDGFSLPERGEIFLRNLPASKTLTAYGIGAPDSKPRELISLLQQEARKKGWESAALVIQVLHLGTKPDQVVTQMVLAVPATE